MLDEGRREHPSRYLNKIVVDQRETTPLFLLRAKSFGLKPVFRDYRLVGVSVAITSLGGGRYLVKFQRGLVTICLEADAFHAGQNRAVCRRNGGTIIGRVAICYQLERSNQTLKVREFSR